MSEEKEIFDGHNGPHIQCGACLKDGMEITHMKVREAVEKLKAINTNEERWLHNGGVYNDEIDEVFKEWLEDEK